MPFALPAGLHNGKNGFDAIVEHVGGGDKHDVELFGGTDVHAIHQQMVWRFVKSLMICLTASSQTQSPGDEPGLCAIYITCSLIQAS
jgi:hypothetical protein